ncbi:MAG: prepilin-type N-terminal cleavage/methylation domain-containing protein [Gemmatimonas sp.]
MRVASRSGFTLIEQIVVITVLGILAALAVHTIGQQLDKLAVRAAARDTRDVFASAREFAVARGVRTAVQIEPLPAEVSAHASADTIISRPLGTLHGVTLSTSRDSMAYSPSGLGYGASNLRIIVVKRSAAETVTVSRLGRVR